MQFTVIFEYGIPRTSCSAVRAWGQLWVDLKALPPSDPNYRVKLQAITDQFVNAGANPGQRPNRSALNQLRTNEIPLSPILRRLWELREFKLDSTGQLASVTTKQEPDRSFNASGSMTLANWANANAALVAKDAHVVPELLPGTTTHFLGARAPVPTPGFFWGNGVNMHPDTIRFHLSLNTCSGCHAGETRTTFTHVKPEFGLPAPLSQFLTGTSPDVQDPDPPPDPLSRAVHFNDLERRAQNLDELVNSSCLRQVVFQPIARMTH